MFSNCWRPRSENCRNQLAFDHPSAIDDARAATDAEIIDADIQDGLTEQDARTYLAVIRSKPDPRLIID